MKKWLFTFAIALTSLLTNAQAPSAFSYQAVVRDASNDLVVSSVVGMQISILQGSSAGAPVYVETHIPTTNANGLISLQIGGGVLVSGDFSAIDWNNGPYVIKTETDPTGGTSYTIAGTQQLLNVPYALYANTAETVTTALSVNTTDELQNLSISGDTIFISSGNYVVLPPLVPGCTDPSYLEYNPLADTSDGSCLNLIVNGCTDALACNYDSTATVDDGSCTFAVTGFDCAGNCLTGVSVVYTAGSYAGENSFTITDCNGATLAEMTNGYNGFDACVTLGSVYTISLVDSYGDNWNGGSLNVDGVDYTIDAFSASQSSASFTVGACPVYGCTDSLAANYDAAADTDDGSCTYLAIGDTHQGGIVFYLDGNGGGLIAAPSDQSSGAQWGCYGTDMQGTGGTAIGTGTQNTIDIINANCPSTNGTPTAADICANYTDGTYSDWFLPSKDEIYEMYSNIGQGDALGLGNIGGFANSPYWSSSEHGNYNAWGQYFNGGAQGNNWRFSTFIVRAVRAF
jgi:hypothetical protein